MQVLAVLALCASACLGVNGALAPFITKCRAADTSCMTASAQKAVPILAAGLKELGLQVLDPMKIDLVKADQAGLKIEFRNTEVRGLRNCQVKSVKRNKNKQFLEMLCSVTLIGNYTIAGKLLVMPVEGDGEYMIKIRDILVKVQYDLGERTSHGDKYWTLVNWKYTSEVQTGAVFAFKKLFHGKNKLLSDTVHEFANSNWKDIFQEVAPPIVKAIISKIVEEVAKFYNKVPVKELALD